MSRPSVPDGTRRVRDDGYAVVRVEGRWVLEHRHVMAALLGRALTEHDEVRHVPGADRADNRAETLVCWTRFCAWPVGGGDDPANATPGGVKASQTLLGAHREYRRGYVRDWRAKRKARA